MNTLYLELNMGAAGDMLLAALLELLDEPDAFIARLNALGLPGVRVTRQPSVKCGVTGTHVDITVGGESECSDDVGPEAARDECGAHDHDMDCHTHEDTTPHEHFHTQNASNQNTLTHSAIHHRSTLADIRGIISALPISESVQSDAIAVYDLIAGAEARVHGCEVGEVHFHELGALDAVADIVGVCLLIEYLAPGRVIASPVNLGSGSVRCGHGVLPVPAPATAWLIAGMPVYSGAVKGELLTPTGAALLKHFVSEFMPMPLMTVSRIGYGMGKKDFEAANCVRAFLGETVAAGESGPNGRIAQLECNLDDMTGEAIAYATRRLLDAGALDVFATPIQMKKSRPGVKLSVLCGAEDADKFAALMLRHTSTLGVRKTLCERYTLARETRSVNTQYGDIRVKRASGYGICKSKPEFDDVAAAAEAAGVTFSEVLETIVDANEK